MSENCNVVEICALVCCCYVFMANVMETTMHVGFWLSDNNPKDTCQDRFNFVTDMKSERLMIVVCFFGIFIKWHIWIFIAKMKPYSLTIMCVSNHDLNFPYWYRNSKLNLGLLCFVCFCLCYLTPIWNLKELTMEDGILCIFVQADRLFNYVCCKARNEGTCRSICYYYISVCINKYHFCLLNKSILKC
jgi:hypothetical protein